MNTINILINKNIEKQRLDNYINKIIKKKLPTNIYKLIRKKKS